MIWSRYVTRTDFLDTIYVVMTPENEEMCYCLLYLQRQVTLVCFTREWVLMDISVGISPEVLL